MAPTARLPPKKDVALALLEQASMYIHLDPRADSVKVPASFKNQPQLVLQVGLNMAVAIPDLHVDEHGLSCTLSFNRTPFFCMIPWPAVFALVGENGQAMVWAEDVPAEVAAQAQAQKAPAEKPRPHLRSVGEGESAPPAAAKAESAPGAEKKPAAKGSKAAAKASSGKTEAGKPSAKASSKAKGAAPKSVKTAPKPAAKSPTKPAKNAEGAPAKKPAAAKPEPATAQQAVPAKKTAPAKPEAARSASELGKPKRELPPYLRVVK